MDPSQMTAGQINKALDKLDKESSRITDEFIESGRGHERPSEYLRLNDPLSRRARENSDARYSLRNEIERRYGPGAPSRLPMGRGFGPLKSSYGGADDSSDCGSGRCDDCREPECPCRCHTRVAYCSCGAGYTREEWDALPFVGRVRTLSKGHTDPVKIIESRTCRYCHDSAVEEFPA